MRQPNISYFTILILSTFLAGCIKSIDAGISTTVTGIVFDNNKQQPIPNIPIYIHEYESDFFRLRYKATIDSAKSGPDGKYNITFFTTGKGSEYRINFRPSENFYTLQNASTLNIGMINIVDFSAMQFHILKARLQMIDNPNPPMRVSTIAGLQARVWGTNNDTVVFMKIIPNNINELKFTITNVDTPRIYNYRADTINFSGFQDTFNITIPLAPTFFPKRG
jgi:hypothetical protein